MQEMDQGLLSQKEEFQLKMESLQNRRNDHRRKEGQLKESLIKFDKFLRENEAKKARANKKTHEERRIREAKEHEIIKLRDQMAELSLKKDRQNKLMKTSRA